MYSFYVAVTTSRQLERIHSNEAMHPTIPSRLSNGPKKCYPATSCIRIDPVHEPTASVYLTTNPSLVCTLFACQFPAAWLLSGNRVLSNTQRVHFVSTHPRIPPPHQTSRSPYRSEKENEKIAMSIGIDLKWSSLRLTFSTFCGTTTDSRSWQQHPARHQAKPSDRTEWGVKWVRYSQVYFSSGHDAGWRGREVHEHHR